VPRQIKKPCQAFLQGFATIISADWIKFFNPKELQVHSLTAAPPAATNYEKSPKVLLDRPSWIVLAAWCQPDAALCVRVAAANLRRHG
jgi:hypothetical protein